MIAGRLAMDAALKRPASHPVSALWLIELAMRMAVFMLKRALQVAASSFIHHSAVWCLQNRLSRATR
jgi:hypothetical protein